MALCKVCTAIVSRKARVSLHGTVKGAKQVAEKLLSFLDDQYANSRSQVHAYLVDSHSYVCKECCNLLKKLTDLEAGVEKLKSVMFSKFESECVSCHTMLWPLTEVL